MNVRSRGNTRTQFSVKAIVGAALAVALSITGCAQALRHVDPPSGFIAAPSGLPGYQHGVDRSGFSVGANAHRALEHGYSKKIGDSGTFALDTTNGSAYGVPRSHAMPHDLTPYGKSPADHNAFVRTYFVKNGIPADQIGAVQVRTLLEVTERSDETVRPTPRVTGYYSVLPRQIDGIPVLDSFAWARVNAQGQIVEEAVYWPAIPAAVVSQLRNLREEWADPDSRRALESRLPSEASKTRVVIRHSSASSHDPFEAFAGVDVQILAIERVTPQGLPNAVPLAQARAAYVRHFDAKGVELFLPQEKFHLERQLAEHKTPPNAR